MLAAMDKEWIKKQLADRGHGAQVELAHYLGLSATVTNKLVNSSRKITADEAEKIKAFFQKEPHDPPRAQMTSESPTPGRPDIPVWASAEAGNDGAMVLVNDPIDYIRRSERMLGVRNPFAFHVIGVSMSPAVEHGDQVVIHPGLPPLPGREHVFLQYQEDGTILALVKRLMRSGGSVWKVRQFNPPKDFDLPKGIWSKAYVVVEKRLG